MKSGKEFFESLHPVEQANWEESLKHDPHYHPKRRDHLMNKLFIDLGDFLGSSFIWSATTQGHEYWDLLSQK